MQIYIFACIHNAGRSQMAGAFFNLLADPKLARSFSAGSAPIAHVHPEVIRVMREEGIDLAKSHPQKLTHELVNQAKALVTIGCDEDWPPVPGLQRLDWPIPDPRGKDIPTVRAIRDEIKSRIIDLLQKEGIGREGILSLPSQLA
jgi:arsenate reductase (thioredoxin)